MVFLESMLKCRLLHQGQAITKKRITLGGIEYYKQDNHADYGQGGETMKLSARLEAVAARVLVGLPAADIGADHALLSVYLIRQGICPRMVIGEVADGPYKRARRYVRSQDLHRVIEVRKGNGLEVLAPAEVATVVIAGLGGKNTADILCCSLARAYTYQRFVFQPMRPVYPLRKLIADLGWAISHEDIVRDTHDYYPVITVEPRRHPAYELDDLELELGPLVLEQAQRPEVRGYLGQELSRHRGVVAGLERSNSPAAEEKLLLYRRRVKRLKEMIDHG